MITIRKMALALMVVTLAGCSSAPGTGSKIGTGVDDYKESPCACKEVPQRGLNQFVS